MDDFFGTYWQKLSTIMNENADMIKKRLYM